MAIQRMYHPDHGYDHAYDSAGVKRMQEAGWKVQTEDEFQAVLASKNGEPEEVVEAVAKKKPGPKPKAA